MPSPPNPRSDPEGQPDADAMLRGRGTSHGEGEEQPGPRPPETEGPWPMLLAREVAVTTRENVASDREHTASEREGAVNLREETSRMREEALRAREDAAAARATAQALLNELRDANERLVIVTVQAQTLAEEAQRATRLKDEFLATVSHELRTPLNAVIGWARILGELHLPARAQDGVAAIHRSASTLLHVVDDLLDVARSIAGNFGLDTQPLDPVSVAREAVDAMRPEAEARGLALTFASDGGVRAIRGDPGRLQQIMANLLSNAFKFSRPGDTVTVRVGGSGDTVDIEVTDTGEGISPAFLPYVFDRFRQADAATSRRHGGLGLGLAIARRLAELHGGSIEASSPGEGQGATFTLRFPHASEPLTASPGEGTSVASPPPETSQLAARALGALRVLVIDDDEDARVLTGLVLAGAGAEVQEVSTARDALRVLEAAWPDVLVSDIGLPDEDGYALITRWRQHERVHGGFVPALALTGYARPLDRARTAAAGFQAYAAKPVEPAHLVTLIARLAQSVPDR